MRFDFYHCDECGVCVEGSADFSETHKCFLGICICDANYKYYLLMQFYGVLQGWSVFYGIVTIDENYGDQKFTGFLIVALFIFFGIFVCCLYNSATIETYMYEDEMARWQKKNGVPAKEIYDRTNSCRKFGKACKGFNPILWLVPI